MFVYGPVPSRRLGKSLGVSVIPHKTCSYSCVYCQLGRTIQRRINLRSFYPRESVLKEIEANLDRGNPDYIAFVGDGEPTLSSDLGWYINQCKNRWPVPIAVITNGSLLYSPEVRDNLANADMVLPSLDAANEKVFRKINRPHRDLEYDKIVTGLKLFSRDFSGKIRLETMLVHDLNDSEEHLRELKKIIDEVNPDTVDISIPIRPPAEKWVEPPPLEIIIKAQQILGGTDSMTYGEQGSFGLANFKSVQEAVEQLSSRHPLRLNQALEIERSFGQTGEIENLIQKGALRKEEFQGNIFIVPNKNDTAKTGIDHP